MSKHPLTWQQQKELLNLKADVVRLQLLAAQLHNRAAASQARHHATSDWLKLLDSTPLIGLAFKLARKPKHWRNKLLLGTLLGAATLLRRSKR